MADSNNKLPINIVNIVIDKISDFTKELEILRGQLPSKEMLESDTTALLTAITSLGTTLKDFLYTVKIITGVAGGIILLVVIGVQLVDYVRDDSDTTIETAVEQNTKYYEQIIKDINTTHKLDIENLRTDLIEEMRAYRDEELQQDETKK
jgi:hypothetical protein